MKTRKLSSATFILGALGATIAACGAQSSGTPPRGDGTGNSSNGGTGNVTIQPGAGTGNVGVNPSGGSVSNNGGTTSVAGTSSGVAGSTVIPAGGAVGGGGAPAIGTCATAVGTATDLSIDDLEDGDNTIQALGQRTGYWYTYNDGTVGAMQVPAPDPTGVIPFKPVAGGHSPLFSAETTGTVFSTWGAGMGFDFNNTAMKSCVYNATAYSGIKFWAKGTVPLKAMVKIPGTTQSTSDSGTCTAAAMCEDHYTLTPVPILSTTWTQYTIAFAGGATFAQAGWGVPVAFDKANIIAVQFQVNMGAAFDVDIDDVTFY